MRQADWRFFGAILLLSVVPPVCAGDGDLDPTWGVGGIGNGWGSWRAAAATPTGAGRIALWGERLSDPDDMSFISPNDPGAGSWYSCCGWEGAVPFLVRFEARAAFVDRDGRGLFAGAVGIFGSEATDRAFVARTEPSPNDGPFGLLDLTFSDAGWEYFDDSTNCDIESCRFVDIAETESGTTRYVLLLERPVAALAADYFLVGLEEDGDLDLTFGTNGYRWVSAGNFGQTTPAGARLEVDSLGRSYVLHSHADLVEPGDFDVGLTRFTSGGSLDHTFASAGTRFVDNDEGTPVSCLPGPFEIGSDGRLVMVCNEAGGGARLLVLASGNGGAPSTELGFSQGSIDALDVDGFGRIVLVIDRDSDGFDLRREIPVFPSGWQTDTTFGTAGTVFVDVDEPSGDGEETPVDLVVEGGRFYVVVDADGPPAADDHIVVPVRLDGSLLFTDGFEWGSAKFWSRSTP